MAKFKFVGDPNDNGSGASFIEYGGYVFDKDGQYVEVQEDTDEGMRLARKLRGNSHFEEEGSQDKKKPQDDMKQKQRESQEPQSLGAETVSERTTGVADEPKETRKPHNVRDVDVSVDESKADEPDDAAHGDTRKRGRSKSE